MHLKKESRILVISKLSRFIVGLVIRGVEGVENSVLFRDCDELYNFLSQGLGLAGEINYIISSNNLCVEVLQHQKVKTISLDDVKDRQLLAEIREILRVLQIVSLKYTVYRLSRARIYV